MLNNIVTKLGLAGFLAWLIPLVVSFFFFDRSTNSYKPNYLAFKVIMLFTLVLTAIILYLYIRSTGGANWLLTTLVFILFSCVLDVLVLINIFKGISIEQWVLTVLPVYLVVFTGLSYLLLRKEKLIDQKTA
jgi:hypothetical protein